MLFAECLLHLLFVIRPMLHLYYHYYYYYYYYYDYYYYQLLLLLLLLGKCNAIALMNVIPTLHQRS